MNLRRVLILADESADWMVAGLRQLDRLALSIDEFAVDNNDSPIWNRGNVSRSKRTTEWPRCASEMDADEPAGPPPTTAKSKSY